MPKLNIQFFLSTVSAEERGAKPHSFPGFTLVYYPMRPQSRGWVRIRSRDPREAPAIQPKYLSTEYDRRIMIEGETRATHRGLAFLFPLRARRVQTRSRGGKR